MDIINRHVRQWYGSPYLIIHQKANKHISQDVNILFKQIHLNVFPVEMLSPLFFKTRILSKSNMNNYFYRAGNLETTLKKELNLIQGVHNSLYCLNVIYVWANDVICG